MRERVEEEKAWKVDTLYQIQSDCKKTERCDTNHGVRGERQWSCTARQQSQHISAA